MRDYLGAIFATDEDAQQHGVKGMKWGVRRSLKKLAPDERKAFLDQKDKKLISKMQSPVLQKRAANMALRNAKAQTKQLNKQIKQDGVNLKKDALQRSIYEAKVQVIHEQAMHDAAQKTFGKSKTGFYQAGMRVNPTTHQYEMALRVPNNPKIGKQLQKLERSDTRKATKAASIQHADDGTREIVIPMITDEEGFIVDYELPDELMHSDDVHDYLGNRVVEGDDKLDHGIKGMKWGVRRTDAQLSTDTKARASKGEKVTPTKKATAAIKSPAIKAATGEETSSQRYDRLASQAKDGRAHEMSDTDLKFFNARTEAIAKINKLNETNPSWLRTTSKKVLQQAAQNTMQSVADGVAKKYISGPILDQINTVEKKD